MDAAFVIAIIAAIPVGIIAWVVVSTYTRFVRSGGQHTPTGERMPLMFRFGMPFIKGFSKLFADYLRSKGVGGEHQTVLPWEAQQQTPQGTRSPALRWLYERTRQSILAAGSPHGLEVEDYWGFACLCVIVGIGGLGLGIMLGSIIGLILGLITFGLFSLLPFVYISDSIRRRHGRVRKELPFALDLLTLSVEAGMDFTAALGNIVDRLRKSPLAQEFDQTVKEINIGKQRSDALRDMARRIAMSEVNSVVSALIQADQLGSGLGEVLRIQAEDVRMRRFQNAEKRASEVPVKMLFPLVAFIFPVTFIIIAAPLVIRFLRIWLGGLG